MYAHILVILSMSLGISYLRDPYSPSMRTLPALETSTTGFLPSTLTFSDAYIHEVTGVSDLV